MFNTLPNIFSAQQTPMAPAQGPGAQAQGDAKRYAMISQLMQPNAAAPAPMAGLSGFLKGAAGMQSTNKSREADALAAGGAFKPWGAVTS